LNQIFIVTNEIKLYLVVEFLVWGIRLFAKIQIIALVMFQWMLELVPKVIGYNHERLLSVVDRNQQ
jgi:hypothetical protein